MTAISQFAAEPDDEITARVDDQAIDVLIVTALEDELDAVLALGEGWTERRDLAGFPYHFRRFPRAGKPPLAVAAAWLGKMGRLVAAIRGGELVRELEPLALAMCGICAGMRGEVALGDVIIADRLFSYDEGKLVAEPGKEPEIQHDIKTHDLLGLMIRPYACGTSRPRIC